MTLRFVCPSCGKRLKTAEQLAGRQINCPRCGTAVEVPEAEDRRESESPAPGGDQAVVAEPEDALTFSSGRRIDDEMDMTPMIDCVFLLLIFFLVTSAFALQKSLLMPQPDAEQSAAPNRTITEIEEDDDYVIVRIDGENTVWVNDSEAPSDQELLSQLRAARRGIAGQRPPTSLLVLAAGDAWHETVVRALDAGSAVGMEHVRLATEEE
ncbi:MAG: biopolymer transporter ExbD [Planctomycetes bacterium]|nr:biopolymer transporter ExbD [Planctomycetota bacterium]